MIKTKMLMTRRKMRWNNETDLHQSDQKTKNQIWCVISQACLNILFSDQSFQTFVQNISHLFPLVLDLFILQFTVSPVYLARLIDHFAYDSPWELSISFLLWVNLFYELHFVDRQFNEMLSLTFMGLSILNFKEIKSMLLVQLHKSRSQR